MSDKFMNKIDDNKLDSLLTGWTKAYELPDYQAEQIRRLAKRSSPRTEIMQDNWWFKFSTNLSDTVAQAVQSWMCYGAVQESYNIPTSL